MNVQMTLWNKDVLPPVPSGNGDSNKLLKQDRPVHDWYRFVLSYPPHLVRRYLERFGIAPGQRVLDPFCGTGTTLVECKKSGLASVGVEAHPMSAFASAVKVNWNLDARQLLLSAEKAARAARRELKGGGFLEDGRTARCLNPAASLRTLCPDRMRLLLGDSISPLPLHRVLTLLEQIDKQDKKLVPCLRLALAKALVGSVGNLHFGPEVGVGEIKDDTPVIEPWLANVRAMADDLGQLPRDGADAQVHNHDSRLISQVVSPNSIDAVITSPPYPNEKDYTRTTRLESVILGFISSREQLAAFKQGLIRSNTRNVYKGDDDDKWIVSHPRILAVAEEIEARRISMGKTSGFERMYTKVARLYFGGMARHLSQLREVLRPGARLAYVVGDQASFLRVMIRTGQLLAEIAEGLGYKVEGIDLFRTRLATATREQLREEVVILRWKGN